MPIIEFHGRIEITSDASLDEIDRRFRRYAVPEIETAIENLFWNRSLGYYIEDREVTTATIELDAVREDIKETT